MEKQLKLLAESYDNTIDIGRKGINLYERLPEYITNDPDYQIYLKWATKGSEYSKIVKYLSPEKNMDFIDMGCCLNLMFRGYDKWPSTYHGIDISSKTISLLKEFTSKNKLAIGSLHCASIHKTPFKNNYFDIGACIGVLEYFEQDFVSMAIAEAHRIIKPYGKLVLDIPDIENPFCRIMILIEEHLGRSDKFNISPLEFEEVLYNYFEIEEIEKIESDPMIRYFLRCKK